MAITGNKSKPTNETDFKNVDNSCALISDRRKRDGTYSNGVVREGQSCESKLQEEARPALGAPGWAGCPERAKSLAKTLGMEGALLAGHLGAQWLKAQLERWAGAASCRVWVLHLRVGHEESLAQEVLQRARRSIKVYRMGQRSCSRQLCG